MSNFDKFEKAQNVSQSEILSVMSSCGDVSMCVLLAYNATECLSQVLVKWLKIVIIDGQVNLYVGSETSDMDFILNFRHIYMLL